MNNNNVKPIDKRKPNRSLDHLLYIYLKIIPEEPSTTKYRSNLNLLKNELNSPDTCYWSPELLVSYWDKVNNVLKHYNEKFIENDWAKAILFICIYDYSKCEVKPYLELLLSARQKPKERNEEFKEIVRQNSPTREELFEVLQRDKEAKNDEAELQKQKHQKQNLKQEIGRVNEIGN